MVPVYNNAEQTHDHKWLEVDGSSDEKGPIWRSFCDAICSHAEALEYTVCMYVFSNILIN